MTPKDAKFDLGLIDWAAQNGYSWNETKAAVTTLKMDRLSRSEYWQHAGYRALMNATRRCLRLSDGYRATYRKQVSA